MYKNVAGEIIAIGDELTCGRVTNTTSRLAARKLFLLGYDFAVMQCIGDDPAEPCAGRWSMRTSSW